MKNNYEATVHNFEISSGLIAGRIKFEIDVSPKYFRAGKGSLADLSEAINQIVNEINKAIERSNKDESFTGTVITYNDEEYIEKDGKLVPKE